MIRQDDNTDPEAIVRSRVMSQLQANNGGAVPDATADPVYAPPDPPPNLPTPVQPSVTTQPVAPSVQAPTAPQYSPGNSPAELAAANAQDQANQARQAQINAARTASGNPVQFDQQNPNGPAAPAAPTPPPSTSRTDPSYILSQIAKFAALPGANPSLRTDPNYWLTRITQTGGLGADNLSYWQNLAMRPEGAPEGGAAAQGGQLQAPQAFTSSSASNGMTAPQGLWDPGFTQQLRSLLMQRLQAAGQPVDPNDPNITAPLTAARDEATRQTDTERNQLAEHLYASGGLNTDAITQQIQQSGERNATGLGGLRATLITKELDSRRSELKDLMQMALASGDAESARMIQMQIAELTAQVNREGQNLDAQKYAAFLNQNAALAGLGGQ